MDERRLKESFARAAAHSDEVALFYSHLFLGHPEVRDLFPVSVPREPSSDAERQQLQAERRAAIATGESVLGAAQRVLPCRAAS